MTTDAGKERAMALLLYMNLIGTEAKRGGALAKPYLDAEAIEVMPDGAVAFHRERFLRVMAEAIAKL